MSKHNQAMVVSVDERQMILLCQNGTWKAVRPEPGRAVGDVIRLGSVGANRRWSSLVAAVLLIVTLAATSIILPAKQAMAHVSLDGIPGVELVTNGRGRVLDSVAETATGEDLLHGLRLNGRSLADAVQQLLQRAEQLSLLPEDLQVVLVAIVPAQEQISESVLRRLNAQAESGVQTALVERSAAIEVEQIVVSRTLQAEAKALGLSAGQYALALKAVEAGVQLQLDQITDGNVVQALQSQGLNPGQMIKQLKQNPDLDQLLRENKDKLKSEDKPVKETKDPGKPSPAAGAIVPVVGQNGSQGKGQTKSDRSDPQVGSEQPGDSQSAGAGKADDGANGGPAKQAEQGEGEQGKGTGNRTDDAEQDEAGKPGQEDETAPGDARSSGPEDRPKSDSADVDTDNGSNGNKSGTDKEK